MALLLRTVTGSIIFGSSRMEPDRQAGWVKQGDDSFRYDLKIGAALEIAPDGKLLRLLTSTPTATKGGALTRAVDEVGILQLVAQQAAIAVPIVRVNRLGELKPLAGVGWILGPNGWELPFEKAIPQTSKIMALFISSGGHEAGTRLEVQEYSWCPTAMNRVLNPPPRQKVCPKCGDRWSAKSTFCGSCGTKF